MADRGHAPEAPGARPARGAGRWGERLLAALFLAALWLPLAEMTFHLVPSPDTVEKRRLAAAPTFSLRTITQFPWAYQRYFDDNFGLRAVLIHWDTTLRLKLLHVSPVPELIFGREGWIYYDSERVQDGITIRDFKGLAPLTPGELRSIRDHLGRRARWCRARGIACLYVVAPNKETIYPEYLPPTVRRIGARTRLDQVVEAVRADSSIQLVDLRGPLLQAKTVCPHRLYFRGGTHWNQCGAYYAYRTILSVLSRSFPRLRPYDLGDFDVLVTPRSAEDHWLGLKEDDAYRFALKSARVEPGEREEIGKALVIHDSAWDALEPFLALHCRTIVEDHTDPAVDRSRPLLERERPDLVLYEIKERYLGQVLAQVWPGSAPDPRGREAAVRAPRE
jgi:hypothetical protein